MTFGSDHYVPVLKVKRGEKNALQSIAPTVQRHITPLLEIVERDDSKKPTVDAHLTTAFKGLADGVRDYSRVFLDAREIAPDGPAAAAEVFHRASNEGIVFVPVTGISRTTDLAAALRHNDHGVALRLTRDEFERGGLKAALRRFVRRHRLTLEQTDLIVDLGPVDTLVAPGVAALTGAFLSEVPHHRQWRTFVLSACAFPLNMGNVERHSHARVDRAEWIAWRDYLHADRKRLPRLPTFGDCAIQHALGVEGFDPRIMQTSASIRFAVSDDWLLIKGESTRVNPPSIQFPSLAKQLVYGHLRADFPGETHCEGCRLIKAAADGAPRLGGLEAWRRIGTIHHITTVMQDIESLLSL